MKASHLFNLLDARGVISVTERAAYIGRVRRWRGCCEAWIGAERRRIMADLLLELISEEFFGPHADPAAQNLEDDARKLAAGLDVDRANIRISSRRVISLFISRGWRTGRRICPRNAAGRAPMRRTRPLRVS